MSQPIITLTADWGVNNYFAGMVKGRLLRNIPGAVIVDISLDIDSYDRQQAAFIVRQACREFPQGTIHIIDVDSVARKRATTHYPLQQPAASGEARQAEEKAYSGYKHIIVLSGGQYYITADNGIIGVALGSNIEKAVVLNTGERVSSFACFDYYCDAAALLARGVPMEELGQPHGIAVGDMSAIHLTDSSVLNTTVAYVDTYGNAYLNISHKQFEQIRAGRRFRAVVHENIITTVSTDYTSNNSNGLMLTVSATGQMQLVLLHRSANQLYNLEKGNQVRFVFRDNE